MEKILTSGSTDSNTAWTPSAELYFGLDIYEAKHKHKSRLRCGTVLFDISQQSSHSWGTTNMATCYGFQFPLKRHSCCYQNLWRIYLVELGAICAVRVPGCGGAAALPVTTRDWQYWHCLPSGRFSQRTPFGGRTHADGPLLTRH